MDTTSEGDDFSWKAPPLMDTKRFILHYGIAVRWKMMLVRAGEAGEELDSLSHYDYPSQLAWAYIKNVEPTPDALRSGYTLEDVRVAEGVYRDPSRQFFITARVLARQSNREISERCGIPVSAVELYKLLFLDIDELLPNKSTIQIYVLDPPGVFDPTRYVMLKLCYACPEMAEELLQHVSYFGQQHDLRTEEGRTRERFEIMIGIEQLIREQPEEVAQLLPSYQELISAQTSEAPLIAHMFHQQVKEALARMLPDDSGIVEMPPEIEATHTVNERAG